MKNKFISYTLIAAIVLSSGGCASDNDSSTSNAPTASGAAPIVSHSSAVQADVEALVASGFFSNRDFDSSYDAAAAVSIDMGNGIVCDSPNVKVLGSTATITAEGTYILSGTATDGKVIVDAASTDKIQLVLDNVSITSMKSAPLYIKQADKVFVTLAEGSDNVLENGGSFETIDENNIDAALFSKDDLTINGSGSLTVSSPAGHGIASNDSLSITGGSFDISCASNALKANDDICIAEGSFVISSGKDAIQAEHDENVEKGFVYIADGEFDIRAEGDGLSAGAYMLIDGGSFTLLTGGGHENAAEKSSEMWGQFMPGSMRGAKGGMGRGERPGDMTPPELPVSEKPELPENMPLYDMEKPQRPEGAFAEKPSDQSTSDGSSMKGFKAKGELTVNGGSFTVDSADDGFHSDLNVNINAGEFEISAGDDAMHAEENLIVNGGKINISDSYEGMEALHLFVFGGEIVIQATDDGLNAAGGTDGSGFGGRDTRFGGAMGQNSGGSIAIAGGNISIMAYGDGLDANGSIDITGGSTTVCGPTYGDTAILDYYSTAKIDGGSFIGSGSAMMAQKFSEAAQGVVSAAFDKSFPAGTEVEVTDSNGNRVLNFAPALDFEMLIVSTPELSPEETYGMSVVGIK